EWLDPKGKDFPRALEVLAYHAERIKPDIVHINGYREALAEWNAPVIVVAHSCVRSWWRACRHEEPDPRWGNYIASLRAGLNAADRWLAPTAAFRDQVETLYAPATRGSVIWNGAGDYQSAPVKEPFVLAAGRLWDEAKNIALLARAADDVPWLIFAAGAAESPGKGDAQRLDRIRLLGELPHAALLGVMRRAAILAAPAVYEPFGLTILEAATAGCALVLSDLPSLRELWNGAALFVDPHDVDAWRLALIQLALSDSLRLGLQRRARARARRYSLDTMADAYTALYRDCLRPASIAPDVRGAAAAGALK
ncbi:MAG TPA: glycosyltransferase, partial [Xanthobacteraceae bacterium]|nr:glycosyltransferase [Xanthobacteraceae bacterium]